MPLADVVGVYYSGGQRGSKALFSTCSRTTFERIEETGYYFPDGDMAQDIKFADIVKIWSDRHNFSVDSYAVDDGLFLDVVLTLPVPRALLLAAKTWSSYIIPVKDEEGRKVKNLHLPGHLLEVLGVSMDDTSNDIMHGGALGPEDFHNIADAMRHLLQHTPEHAVLLRGESQFYIRRLELVRKKLVMATIPSKAAQLQP